jgi:hypothetical protein
MDPHSSNLILTTASFGPLLINPQRAPTDETRFEPAFVLCTEPISRKNLGTAIEWAASTEAPFFCTPRDADRMEREGFGSYRFQRINGFREIGFQGGSLIFHPAKGPRPQGLKGFLRDFKDAFGWTKKDAFHVVVRPIRGDASLFLSTPHVDSLEWQLLMESKPKLIIGSNSYPQEAWWALSERYGYSIVRADAYNQSAAEGSKSWETPASTASSVL